MKHVIELNAVTLTRGATRILDTVSFTVGHKEHWAFLGPNGSGKTTLINLIAGYLWPTEGTVSVLGDRYGSVDLREKRKSIGFVSSSLFERVPYRETLLDVVMSGQFASLGVYHEVTEADRVRAEKVVSFLHCAGIQDRPYRVLSFGERQRALIGRALMAEPKLLILDEPYEGLDISAREIIINALDSLVADPCGPTVLIITHRVEEIPQGFTHAAILTGGSILAAGDKYTTVTTENMSRAMGVKLEIVRRNGRLYAVV